MVKISGLTSRRFAHQIGITPSGLSGITTGRSKTLSGLFLKIAELRFNISAEWLMEGKGPIHATPWHIKDSHEMDKVLKFRSLDAERKKSVLIMIDAFYKQLDQSEQENEKAEKDLKKTKKKKNNKDSKKKGTG